MKRHPLSPRARALPASLPLAGRVGAPEQFQRKWEPVSRPELRQNKEQEQFQRKWEPVSRPELRQNKEQEQFQRKWEPVSRPELRQNLRVERFRRLNLRCKRSTPGRGDGRPLPASRCSGTLPVKGRDGAMPSALGFCEGGKAA